MKKEFFANRLSSMPLKMAKRYLKMARFGVAVLFAAMLIGTGIAGWCLVTVSNKVLPAVILVLLWIGAFFGGRLQREVHDAGNSLQSDSA